MAEDLRLLISLRAVHWPAIKQHRHYLSISLTVRLAVCLLVLSYQCQLKSFDLVQVCRASLFGGSLIIFPVRARDSRKDSGT